jgi:hypothetical protein
VKYVPFETGKLTSVTNTAVKCLTTMIPLGSGSKSNIPTGYVVFLSSHRTTAEQNLRTGSNGLSARSLEIQNHHNLCVRKIYIPRKFVVRYIFHATNRIYLALENGPSLNFFSICFYQRLQT